MPTLGQRVILVKRVGLRGSSQLFCLPMYIANSRRIGSISLAMAMLCSQLIVSVPRLCGCEHAPHAIGQSVNCTRASLASAKRCSTTTGNEANACNCGHSPKQRTAMCTCGCSSLPAENQIPNQDGEHTSRFEHVRTEALHSTAELIPDHLHNRSSSEEQAKWLADCNSVYMLYCVWRI